MWPRILTLAVLVTMLVGGTPSAGAAHEGISRGHSRAVGAVRGDWSWPVAPPRAVARPYLAPPTPYAAGHRGIDIRSAAGADVLAPDDGVVHFAGTVVDRPVLSISHSGGVMSSFEPVSTSLVAGDAVRRGAAIGMVLPGHCATPCLHLGARVGGEYVNPLVFLGGVGWSVLLPVTP